MHERVPNATPVQYVSIVAGRCDTFRKRIHKIIQLKQEPIDPIKSRMPTRETFEAEGPQYSKESGLMIYKAPPSGYEPTEDDILRRLDYWIGLRNT